MCSGFYTLRCTQLWCDAGGFQDKTGNRPEQQTSFGASVMRLYVSFKTTTTSRAWFLPNGRFTPQHDHPVASACHHTAACADDQDRPTQRLQVPYLANFLQLRVALFVHGREQYTHTHTLTRATLREVVCSLPLFLCRMLLLLLVRGICHRLQLQCRGTCCWRLAAVDAARNRQLPTAVPVAQPTLLGMPSSVIAAKQLTT